VRHNREPAPVRSSAVAIGAAQSHATRAHAAAPAPPTAQGTNARERATSHLRVRPARSQNDMRTPHDPAHACTHPSSRPRSSSTVAPGTHPHIRHARSTAQHTRARAHDTSQNLFVHSAPRRAVPRPPPPDAGHTREPPSPPAAAPLLPPHRTCPCGRAPVRRHCPSDDPAESHASHTRSHASGGGVAHAPPHKWSPTP